MPVELTDVTLPNPCGEWSPAEDDLRMSRLAVLACGGFFLPLNKEGKHEKTPPFLGAFKGL
jgi:hypothetical protein